MSNISLWSIVYGLWTNEDTHLSTINNQPSTQSSAASPVGKRKNDSDPISESPVTSHQNSVNRLLFGIRHPLSANLDSSSPVISPSDDKLTSSPISNRSEQLFAFEATCASPMVNNDKAVIRPPKELSFLFLPDRDIKKKEGEIITATQFGKIIDLQFDKNASDEEFREKWPAHKSFDWHCYNEQRAENWPYVIVKGHKISFHNFVKEEGDRQYRKKLISIDLASQTFDLNDEFLLVL